MSFFEFCARSLEGSYGPLIQTLGIVLFVLIFNFALKALLTRLHHWFDHQHRIWPLSFVTALEKPLYYFVWFVALLCAIETITSSFLSFHLSNMHIVLSVGAVLCCGWFLMRWNYEVHRHLVELNKNDQIALSPVKLDLIRKFGTIATIFITLFLLLDVTGRDMQTLIAFGGIGGLALAFASQQVIANFFGGLMVYITRPFTIGEWVYLPEKDIEGYIEEIGWYMTRIRNFDKRPIYVPNAVFSQTIVITPSRRTHERFHYTIGLRYRDVHVIKAIVDKIKLMLIDHPDTDSQMPIDVYFMNFGPSTLDIEISAYIGVSADTRYQAVKQELLLNIAAIVHKEGAEISTHTHRVEIEKESLQKNFDIPTYSQSYSGGQSKNR